MKENKKGSPAHTFNRPRIKNAPYKRHSNPVDPKEEKQIPITNHPHHEELLDYKP